MKKSLFTLIGTLFTLLNYSQLPACFNTPVNYTSGINPTGVTSADFNSDGKMDIAVANSSNGNVSVLLGLGTGAFAPSVNYNVFANPHSVRSADFNGDGKLDLVTANANNNTISVLLGSGTGAFTVSNSFSVGNTPYCAIPDDFNNDGNLDLVVANYNGNSVSVLFGNGQGNFSPATNYTTGTGTTWVSTGDFNGDGNVDLAASNAFSNNISVLLGSSNGIFAAAISYTTGFSPFCIAAADFNGDFIIDLATSNYGNNGVSVLLGTGNGNFPIAVNYTTGVSPFSIVPNDYNGDGDLDILITNVSSNFVSVLLGSGTGTFGPATTYNVGQNPNYAASGDFNNDGKIDVVTPNFNSMGISVLLNCGIYPYGASLNFDGVDDYVDCGNILPASYTKEAWIRVTNASLENNFLSGSTTGQHALWAPAAYGNKLSAGHNGIWNQCQDPAPLSINTWYHVACTYDAATTTLKLYKNGVLVSSNNSVPTYTAGNSLLIGAFDPLSNLFGGDIDEVRIWNRVLCGGEIQNNKNAQLTLPQNGLIAYYKFNQGLAAQPNLSVTTLTDATINSNNGSLINFALTGSSSNWLAPGAVISGSTVSAYTKPTVTILGANIICPTTSTTLTATGNFISYTWTAGPTTPNYIVSPTSATVYSVVGTNSLGCISPTATKTVAIDVIPTVAVNSGTLCSGISFTITPSGASTYTIEGGNAIVSPTSTTSYTVTGATAAGCLSSNTATSNIAVTQSPIITVNSGTICSGNSFSITANGATSYTYQGGNAIVNPQVNTNYSVVGTNSTGCVSVPVTASVTVNASPSITVNSGAICVGESFTIIPVGANSYTISGNSFIVNPTVTSGYSVTGTNLNGCISNSVTISSVTVNALPNLLVMSNSSLICSGQNATLTATGANSYTWSTGGLNPTEIITPTITTTYTVNGTDLNGCQNYTTLTQSVSLCTGITKLSTNTKIGLSTYPNPNNGIFILSVIDENYISEKILKVKIINIVGEIIYESPINKNHVLIDIQNFAAGIYFLQLFEEGDLIDTTKIIKD